MSDTGIFGIVLNIAVNYVFLFVLFGSILEATGATELFSNIALALVGRRPGGPAEVSTLSSALMGTLSGSYIANVATTGSFTIPLMKKSGYSAAFAGGVEAAASTGGMIMPPIMGAAALIMAGFLGIPYIKIVIAGIIPALLYYLSIFVVIELRAKKRGLEGMKESDLPNIKDVLKSKGHLLLPIIILIYLLVRGNSPTYAATIGIISTIVISSIKGNTRLKLKDILKALDFGAKSAIPVSVICAAIGVVVETISMTGLGSVLATGILSISRGIPLFAGFLVMLVSLVASIGLPATACYVIVVSVAAPALGKFGILAIAAHFFVFWYGSISGMTPPVALASYTAAGVANADPFKTAFEGLKLAFAGFIIPFFIIFNPEILLYEPSEPFQLVIVILKTVIAILAAAIAAEGYLFSKIKIYERAVLFISIILLIQQGKQNIIGVLLILVMVTINWIKNKTGAEIK
jgi:TRAP transporter 4TM/12TM fusion protein